MNEPVTTTDYQPVTRSPATHRLKAFVVSDVHLNNHPFDRATHSENPRRRNFREFLSQLNDGLTDNDQVLLVLNGDILDITGSWFEDVMPWDPEPEKVETLVNKIVGEIVENNAAAFAELRRLIEHPHAEIIFIFGNHDGQLQTYPSSHAVVRRGITEDEAMHARIRFAPSFASEELELYIEHGHMFDPFNHAQGSHPPLGDVINILIVNRFVDMAVDRLRANGYSEELVNQLHQRLHDIEYLRPLALVPVWIQTMITHYRKHPDNDGKAETVDVILMDVVRRILHDPLMIQFMVRQLKLPRPLLTLVIKALLGMPAVLPVISFITSKIVRRTHNNQYQYKMAQRLHQEKGYRLITFGHTHIPGVLPLSKNAYYFNTGSWKPVINLFKFSESDPLDLEPLLPEVQFNKVERCGILRIEKSEQPGKAPVEFALQTIQSGLS